MRRDCRMASEEPKPQTFGDWCAEHRSRFPAPAPIWPREKIKRKTAADDGVDYGADGRNLWKSIFRKGKR